MLEADTESTLAAGQRNTSSDEAAEAEATRLFLLRCCTERAVAGEVDDVMASVGSTTDVSKLIHDTLNERSTVSLLLDVVRKLPSIEERLADSHLLSRLSHALRRALDAQVLSILATAPKTRSNAVYIVTAFLFSGFTISYHERQVDSVTATLQHLARESKRTLGVNDWLALLRCAHSARELADIGLPRGVRCSLPCTFSCFGLAATLLGSFALSV
uniref:Uncharacterized protein n=1 Tax=Chrysotila carterae TaxID=13221 RepID=A0A7S4BFI1_CHRCT